MDAPPSALPTSTWDSRATVRAPEEDASVAVPEGVGTGEALEIRGMLGRGGMGVVHLAVQNSLQREVAVKTLHDEAQDGVARRRLLREAWVTGSLEHPNIVPVYDLGHDGDGRPRLVLKRIDGALWSELLRDPFAVRESFGVRDTLDWHLRTLAQLCSAVAFAHARGVIHRDLKPENVMVGHYGEVYLLDWGLALPLEEAAQRPVGARAGSFSGSPAYMAPEQLPDAVHPLGPHTDLYLLGAMLYEVLHGQPPHQGTTLEEVLAQVRASAPPIDPELPRALRELLQSCLAVDPAERPASAEAVRFAVVDHLEHRHVEAVVERALLQLEELERALDGDDAARRHDLLGACRFGFGQALELDPEHPRARGGLTRALCGMAERALADDDLGAAGLLVEELAGHAPPSLREALEAARARHAKAAARQARIARRHDPLVDARLRFTVLALLSAGWVVLPMVTLAPVRGGATWAQVMAFLGSAFVLGVAVTGGLAWKAESTQANRVLQGVSLLQPTTFALSVLAAWRLGLPAEVSLVMALGGWCTMSLMGAIWYGPGVLPITVTYAATSYWAAGATDDAPLALILANVVFGGTMLIYRIPTLRAALRKDG